jgi:hypothetical protein
MAAQKVLRQPQQVEMSAETYSHIGKSKWSTERYTLLNSPGTETDSFAAVIDRVLLLYLSTYAPRPAT